MKSEAHLVAHMGAVVLRSVVYSPSMTSAWLNLLDLRLKEVCSGV